MLGATVCLKPLRLNGFCGEMRPIKEFAAVTVRALTVDIENEGGKVLPFRVRSAGRKWAKK